MPASQASCSSLLEECFEISQEIRARDESKNVAFALKPIYDRLSEIRAELEKLVLTRRWSLRETDLFNYSLSLQEIDKMRVDGKFLDAEGNRPEGQYVRSMFLPIRLVFQARLFPGVTVLVTAMLWSHLSVIILQRARIGRVDASRTCHSHSF